MRKTAKGLMK